MLQPVLYTILLKHTQRRNNKKGNERKSMRESNMKKVLSWLFTALLICCIGFTTQSVTANAAIVSNGKKNYTYSELRTDLAQLQKRYAQHCKVNVIGQTADKRKLYEVVIGNPDAKKHLLVIGNLHAREHMTTQLCMKQIEYYLKSYNKKINGVKVSATLEKVAIHYVPSCNPDGTAISQKGFGAIRNKNLRKALRRMGGSSSRWKANARGVDLNRNWNIAFRRAGRRGSSGYHGPKAASEREVQALVKWVNRIQKQGRITGLVSYHSTGSILYGRCNSHATRKVRNTTTKMYKVAKRLTGYRLMPTESLSYAGGCSREYFLYGREVPCITLEVGTGAAPLSGGEFSSIWRKNKNVVIREAQLFD